MFIEDNELTEVKVYYKKIRANAYEAYTKKEFQSLKDKNKDKYSALIVKMKELTWGLYNELQDESYKMGPDGKDRQFNYKLFKENRMQRLLVEWDAKDKDDNVVPINSKTILKMAPDIAEAILRGYDEVSTLSEDDKKN